MTSLWISVGEPSGDQRGAELIEVLRQHWQGPMFGIPGPALRRLDVEAIAPMEDLRSIGIAEVAGSLGRTLATLRGAVTACRQRQPAVAILVDYGEFHMRLGKQLRALNIPVFHLAPPKIWAWGHWRIRRLQQSADAVGVLFPFERTFYERYEIPAVEVGHPVAELLDQPPGRGDELWLLPGSRPSEWRRHVDLMVAAADRLRDRLPLRPILGRAPGLGYRPSLPAWLEVRDVTGATDFAHAGLALAASGTVNLELAALGIPQVVVYRTHPLTGLIGLLLVRLPWINPLNLCADEAVVPELLLHRARPRTVADAAESVWSRRDEVRNRSRETVRTLRRPQGLQAAAERILELAR